MQRRFTIVLGAGAGAALVYLLDPARGKRRRALLRDRLVHFGKVAQEGSGAVWRDGRNRLVGVAAEARSLGRDGGASDEVLTARVRAALGPLVSHPRSIEVEGRSGTIVLRGPVLAEEHPELLAGVRKVRGVHDVVDQLEVHQSAEGVPGLQGRPSRRRRQAARVEFLQEHWSPAARALAGTAGGVIALRGLRRRTVGSVALAPAGVALVARAVTDVPVKRIIGVASGRRAVDIQKTINVDAPIEGVFEFWSNYENFPLFMTNVREVRRLDGERSRWTVTGPAGSEVTWEAETTKLEPHREVAWRTSAGAAVQHAGIVRFDPLAGGGTRIHVRMSYNPPAGGLGHAVATILGADPKRRMDQDLLRMKTLLETGKRAHDAAASGGAGAGPRGRHVEEGG